MYGFGCIPYFLGDLRPDGSWIRCRSLSKTRSTVPWSIAQRQANIWLAWPTYPQAPDRLSRPWQMHVCADAIPPLPMG
jgi:hypothetical protein